jgi:predicted nucleic acid-binding protein
MTLQIRDIRTVKPASGRLYFLDANVWLHVLATSPPPRAQPYTDFFQQLLEASDGTPIIAATSLLIAETFNAHLKVGFKIFSEQHFRLGSRPLTFKEDYRPTQDYKNQRDAFLYGFNGYSSFVKIVPDDVEQTDIWQMLERIPAHADFNDFYYARFCRNQGYLIVTDDGDFKFEDVPILTANNNLLALRTN